MSFAQSSVIAGSGFVRGGTDLSRARLYQLTGWSPSRWPQDESHQSQAGFDPTGPTAEPDAESIEWTTLPSLHGYWKPLQSPPIRPRKDKVSIWLRGITSQTNQDPFRVDFDQLNLYPLSPGGYFGFATTAGLTYPEESSYGHRA